MDKALYQIAEDAGSGNGNDHSPSTTNASGKCAKNDFFPCTVYLVSHERWLSTADHEHGCPESPDVGKLSRVALPAA